MFHCNWTNGRFMNLLGLFVFVRVLCNNGVASSKTLKTKYGDIYDCVDFYKQPSFRHPRLQNRSFHPLMRPSFSAKHPRIDPHATGCPIGTVPIRRVTESLSEMKSFVPMNEPFQTYQAGVRTNGTRYGGGGMVASMWNPTINGTAYSQARMRISGGPDAIHVGWRVDSLTRGDNRTRQFIYTNAGNTQCFDALCGFVIVNPDYPLDQVLEPVSKPGGPIYTDKFNITRDPVDGSWWLMYGVNDFEVGFWPKDLFTGLGDFASVIEWAGEVYSPADIKKPAMGSGYKPGEGDGNLYVAYFTFITTVNEYYTTVAARNLQEFATDRSLYDVKDNGDTGPFSTQLVYFGGASK